jgi:hypothetical protein
MRGTVTAVNLEAVHRGLAVNPALDLDLLAPLAHTNHESTLVALASRTDLDASLAGQLARSEHQSVREMLAANPFAAPHVWPLLAGDPAQPVREALAAGQSRYGMPDRERPLPEPAQLALAEDLDVEVRNALAYRGDLTPAVALRLSIDASVRVRRSLASRWRPFPEAVLRGLLLDVDREVRRSALVRSEPPRDRVPWLLADRSTRRETARVAVLDRVQLAGLVNDVDPAVREAVAANPRAALDAVLPLGDDRDEDVRTAMMLRPDLPDDDRARIQATVEPQNFHLAEWLLPANAPLEQRLASVASPFVFCRRAVAFSADLPAAAVRRLAADEDWSVRLLLAEHHPDVPGEILPDLLHSGHSGWELVRLPQMPVEALVAFAESDEGEGRMRRLAATSPNLPPRLAVALSAHADVVTREYAAENPVLPPDRIVELLDDCDISVVAAAARNPSLPRDVAVRLLSPA